MTRLIVQAAAEHVASKAQVVELLLRQAYETGFKEGLAFAKRQPRSAFPGVRFVMALGKWRAEASTGRTHQHLGYYTTEQEAINAAQASRNGRQEPNKFNLVCKHCLHAWSSSKPRPGVCPKCKSYHWDKPPRKPGRPRKMGDDDFPEALRG